MSALNTNPAPTPVTISVLPNTGALTVGDTLQFTATGGAGPYRWSVSNPAVASINTAGQLSALAAGSTTVTAVDNNANAGSSGIVMISAATPPQPVALALTPTTATIGVGQTLQFTATGGVQPYSWMSSNPTIASVNPGTGILSGLALGTVAVSVTDNAGTTVNSGNITVTELSIMPTAPVMAVGDTLQLSAVGGSPPYIWNSSNAAVLSVNTNGVITALNGGNATVSVLDGNGLTASTNPIEVRSLSITPGANSLLIGDTLQFNVSGGVLPYIWSVSNAAIATIDANGLLTANAVGSVSVSVVDADGFSASTGNIQINDGSVVITIVPNTANVSQGRWQRFAASGGTPPYTWRLSNSAAGTIYTNTWPGWFQATGAVGTTTTVIVSDANGNSAESGIVTVINRRRHR